MSAYIYLTALLCVENRVSSYSEDRERANCVDLSILGGSGSEKDKSAPSKEVSTLFVSCNCSIIRPQVIFFQHCIDDIVAQDAVQIRFQ